MQEVEKVVKLIKDVKTDVEFNLKLGLKIKLWLDKKLTCKRCCFQGLSSDQRQTKYVDVLSGGWDTVEKRSREMNKFDCVFPGWWVPDFSARLVAISDVSPGLVGVSTTNYMFLEIKRDRDPVNPQLIVVAALTTGNLPELTSQVCSFYVI